jgi:hypothetical protein
MGVVLWQKLVSTPRKKVIVLIIFSSLIAQIFYSYHNNSILLSQVMLMRAAGNPLIDNQEPDQMLTPKQEGEEQDVDTHANNEKNRGMTHPRLPFPPEILNIIKSTNSSDYSWIGNNFVPPPGVPIFTPSQMKDYFQNRNVLFLGDSTNRRIYGTLKAILDADDPNDVSLEPLERFQRRRLGEDAAGLSTLAENLTSAKATGKFNAIRDRSSNCGPRAIKSKFVPQFGCDNVIGSTADEFAISFNHSDAANHSNNSTGKTKQRKVFFDMGVAYCYRHILWLLDKTENNGGALLNAMKEDYDLIIINNGIWEPLQMAVCKRNANSGLGNLPAVLDTIRDESSIDLQIVFRTSGFAEDKRKNRWRLSLELVNYAKQYFYNISVGHVDNSVEPKPNITLVDFGSVIFKRSFGEKRIKGDNVAHYGIEARLLHVQQLMHELFKAELEKW